MNGSEGVHDELEGVRREWWLYLLLGIALIIFGIAAIALPFIATLTVLTVLGFLFIAGAIVQAVYAFKMGGGASRVIFGVVVAFLYLMAGLVLLAHPIAGILWLTVMLAIYFFVEGVVKIVASIEMRTLPHWGWMLGGGILSLILGLLIAARLPSSAIWVLGLLLGVDLIYGGMTIVALSIAAHGMAQGVRRLAGQH